jgi:hypothetical protein
MVSGLRSLLVPFDSSYEKSDEDVYLNSVVESARVGFTFSILFFFKCPFIDSCSTPTRA